MGFFSEFAGFHSASFAVERKDADVPGKPKVAPTATSDGPDNRARIERKKLETLYLTDPQTYNQIDLYTTIPLQAGYQIKAINKGSQRQYDGFFENIGKYGLVSGEKQLISRLLHDCPLYGYAYVERVFGVDEYDKVRLVDFKPIDAKLMDYARDSDGIIVVDENLKPVGYTMKVGMNSKARGDPLPKGYPINLDIGQIFISEERIACFFFKQYGNGYESIGVVEPAYKDIERKQKIKDTYANSINNNADYKTYAIVGDAQRAASKTVMDNTLNALQNFSTNRFAVFPYPTQLEVLKTEHSPQVEDFLRFERSEQSTASGIALGIAVGSGEAVNRQTISNQQIILDMKLDGWIGRFCEQFNQKILDYIYQFNEYGSKATLEWNDISLEDKIATAEIMLKAVETGALAPEELRKYMIVSYGIEQNDEAYNQMKKDKKEQAKRDSEVKTNNGMQIKKEKVVKKSKEDIKDSDD